MDRQDLTLEERSFLLGSSAKQLPEEFNRVAYNLGLEVYHIARELRNDRHMMRSHLLDVSMTYYRNKESGKETQIFEGYIKLADMTFESAEQSHKRLLKITGQNPDFVVSSAIEEIESNYQTIKNQHNTVEQLKELLTKSM